jgi:hypothetical protein
MPVLINPERVVGHVSSEGLDKHAGLQIRTWNNNLSLKDRVKAGAGRRTGCVIIEHRSRVAR